MVASFAGIPDNLLSFTKQANVILQMAIPTTAGVATIDTAYSKATKDLVFTVICPDLHAGVMFSLLNETIPPAWNGCFVPRSLRWISIITENQKEVESTVNNVYIIIKTATNCPILGFVNGVIYYDIYREGLPNEK